MASITGTGTSNLISAETLLIFRGALTEKDIRKGGNLINRVDGTVSEVKPVPNVSISNRTSGKHRKNREERKIKSLTSVLVCPRVGSHPQTQNIDLKTVPGERRKREVYRAKV